MRAALVNAVHVFDRSDAENLLSLGPIPDDRFGMVNTWREREFSQYALSHCHTGTDPKDEWVMRQTEGVFLLIISGSDVYGDDFQHVLVVDAASHAMIDCCEPHSLKMEWSVLSKCVGNATYLGSVDIRRLHRHDVAKKSGTRSCKRKRTANQIENVKRRREQARELKLYRSVVGIDVVPK